MNFDEIGTQVIASELTEALSACSFQIERTWQILERKQQLAQIKRPLKNQYLELKSGVLRLTTKKGLDLANALTDMKLQESIVRQYLGSNYRLWPFSQGKFASERLGSKIRVALPEKLFSELYVARFSKSKISYVKFRNQVYLKILRGFYKNQALFPYLFGATPYTWQIDINEKQLTPKRSVAWLKQASTISSSELNELKDLLSFDQALFDLGGDYAKRDEMLAKGIHYLEFKGLDLDPFVAHGVTKHQLRLLEVMVGYFLMTEETERPVEMGEAEKIAAENPFAKTAIFVKGHSFLKELDRFAKKFGYADWQGTFALLEKRLKEVETTPSAQLLRAQGTHEDLKEYGFFLAEKYQTAALLKQDGFDANTRSVLAEALLTGLDYQVISADQGLISLNGNLVKAGLQTDKNSALMTEMWQQKELTKSFLQSHGVASAKAWLLQDKQALVKVWPKVKDKAVVVKNALGSSSPATQLFRLPPKEKALKQAVLAQFKTSEQVMIEQVVAGSVYRALFVDGQVVSLIERIPANVVGDGRTPLKELIMKKNARARAKFEELTLGEIERQTLSAQGLKLDSVIARGIQVLLRYDATYATGSQSYEVLDEIDPSYVTELKRIAQLLKLADGALDVVIPNIYQPFEAEAEQLIFLNAHATPTLALHEYVLLEPEKRPLAKKLVERFK